MSESPIPFPPFTDADDDAPVPEDFRLRLYQLLEDPTLTHEQIAMKMVEFVEAQSPPPTPPVHDPTPTKTCQSLPNPANAPPPPSTRILQNEPIFPPPITAKPHQTLPKSPKSNPPPNPPPPSTLNPQPSPRLPPSTLNPPLSPRSRPLTPQQIRAIHLIRAGHPAAVIAHALQINRHTISTWKRLPHFQQELKRQIAQEGIGA